MARPQILQELEHGKLITKSNFPQFVDTWNYMTHRIEGLKGDGDTRPNEGHIKVDNTDPEHPIIRFTGELQEIETVPANFDYYKDDDGNNRVRGGYMMVGRQFYWVNELSSVTLSGLVCLSCSMQSPYNATILQGCDSLSSSNVSATYIPLWYIDGDMKAAWDYRHTPVIQRWE